MAGLRNRTIICRRFSLSGRERQRAVKAGTIESRQQPHTLASGSRQQQARSGVFIERAGGRNGGCATIACKRHQLVMGQLWPGKDHVEPCTQSAQHGNEPGWRGHTRKQQSFARSQPQIAPLRGHALCPAFQFRECDGVRRIAIGPADGDALRAQPRRSGDQRRQIEPVERCLRMREICAASLIQTRVHGDFLHQVSSMEPNKGLPNCGRRSG
jgi:hypothetical protein